MPQGYLAFRNAYTWRYNKVIKDIPHRLKIVDDILVFNYNIEDAYNHTFQYLLCCTEEEIQRYNSNPAKI